MRFDDGVRMNALECYYAAIENHELPATVPIRARDGSGFGLATQVTTFKGIVKAAGLVLSGDPQERAIGAIYALQNAAEAAERANEMVEAATR